MHANLCTHSSMQSKNHSSANTRFGVNSKLEVLGQCTGQKEFPMVSMLSKLSPRNTNAMLPFKTNSTR